jgi:hypothetical protein
MVHPEKRTNSMLFLPGDLLQRSGCLKKKLFPMAPFVHTIKKEMGLNCDTGKVNKSFASTMKNMSHYNNPSSHFL